MYLTYKELCFLRLFRLCAYKGSIKYEILRKETDADNISLLKHAKSLVEKGILKKNKRRYILV